MSISKTLQAYLEQHEVEYRQITHPNRFQPDAANFIGVLVSHHLQDADSQSAHRLAGGVLTPRS